MESVCFHDCALMAYVIVSHEQGTWPLKEDVKKLAYKLYEEALECEKK